LVESFGGAYYMEDGKKLVVLFTDDPEQHRVAVSQLTSAPGKLVFVARALAGRGRSRKSCVRRTLMLGDAVHPGVVSVGLTRDGDDGVIEVGIDPCRKRPPQALSNKMSTNNG
jgi:hypothetical protein